jgi:hypothetical protein
MYHCVCCGAIGSHAFFYRLTIAPAAYVCYACVAYYNSFNATPPS